MLGEAMSILARSTIAPSGACRRASRASARGSQAGCGCGRGCWCRGAKVAAGWRASPQASARPHTRGQPHEAFCGAVHEVEVAAGLVEVVAPAPAQPLDHVLDGVDVLLLFLLGVGVVKAQMAGAAVVTRQAEVQADALGVADVQVAIGLGREAGADALRRAGRRRGGRRRRAASKAAAGIGVGGEVARSGDAGSCWREPARSWGGDL